MSTGWWNLRHRCLAAWAIAWFWLSAIACSGVDESPQNPSADALRGVVLITIDTLRADHLGVYGGPVPTPHLDGLASRGVLLKHAVSPTPSTGPAHASLLTGLHPWRNRVFDNVVNLPYELPTLASSLRDSGVRTAAIVSSFVLTSRFGFARGFDSYEFQPDRGYFFRGAQRQKFWTRGQQTTDLASVRLASLGRPGAAPFFLWVHYFDTHTPYTPPERWVLPETHVVDLTGKTPTGEANTRSELERRNRAYQGEVRYVDDQVGQLLASLKELDLFDVTAVIVTADHGEGLGDHEHLEHGVNLYDELVRVPLIVQAPGIAPGRQLAGPAQLEDLFPTVLDLFGAPIPKGLDGVSLLPWLRGEREESPRYAAVGRRKPYPTLPDLYFYQRWPAKWIGQLGELGDRYALDVDPGEVEVEPGAGPPDWLRARIGEAADTTATTPLTNPDELDLEVREALEALGYLKETGGDPTPPDS